MKYDYVIIGGGVSGMTSALILAKHGLEVAIVEKSKDLAPTVRGFTRKGLYFDTGFHYAGSLGEGEPLDVLFRYLGLSDHIERIPFDENNFDTFRCLEPAVQFEYPYGYDRIKEKFHETFPGEKEAVDTYFFAVKELYSALPYVNPDATGESPKLSAMHEISLQGFLDGLTGNRLLKCILSMHCFLHGVAPDEIPFANHSYVAGSYYESASGISGGGLKLAKAFAGQLKKMSVHVYCGQGVSKILVSGDGALSGVLLEDGTNLSCRGCISTVHPHDLLKMTPNECFRPAYTNRLKSLEETASACILYATCKEPISSLMGSNLFVFPKPDFSFLRESLSIEEQPLYITGAGRKGDSSKHGFIAISPVSGVQAKQWTDAASSGNRPADYKSIKDEMTEKIKRFIEASCPEIAGRITDIECATPLTLRDYTNSPFGSLYGVKHKIGQYNPLPATRIKGLFLAGQAITAPGIMGATMSGFLACGNIFGHESLQKELRECRPEG